MEHSVTRQDRFRGALLGLAAGDALGTTLEFKRPGDPSVPPLTDIVGGGPFNLIAGQWTDDTSMALCLAESLLERRTFDPVDQLSRYQRWYKEGHLSSNGQCFDIGITTRMALNKFEQSGNTDPYPASAGEKSRAGNGSLMRLSPVVLAYAAEPLQALEKASDSSRTTHGSVICVDACRYYAALIVGALTGVSKDELLSSDIYSPVAGHFQERPLAPEIGSIARGEYKTKQPPAIVGTGYVANSLEAALWAFHSTSSFEEGALKVANLGDDADTTAAIYGQLAGAYYGVNGIPERWRKKLALLPLLTVFADELYFLSSELASSSTGGPASERYVLLQKAFTQLENGWAPVQRKLLPGPRMYTSVQAFTDDIAALRGEYEAATGSLAFGDEEVRVWFEEAKAGLWADFVRRATAEEEKIRHRVGRGAALPPPPPPVGVPGGPPPPPAPVAVTGGADSAGGGDGRTALLGAISGFSRAGLKKAETKDKSGLIPPVQAGNVDPPFTS